MHTYFISDLHLSPDKPALVLAFFEFLEQQAPSAEALYIIGDLFEYWIGDDAAESLGAGPLLAKMKRLSDQIPCYFVAGNRDFLVREEFTQLTGFEIIPDETVIDLYGTPTLVLHGDSLCTDDHAHMEFREKIVTNAGWCDTFLAADIPGRIELAKQARMESNQHKSQISMEIMDVSESAVVAAFEIHQVTQMIHGHTHRQAVHQHETKLGPASRYVLGDWGPTDSVLRIDQDGITITNTAIKVSWLARLAGFVSKVRHGKTSLRP